MSNTFLRVNSPRVVSETIDGEVIIINLELGNYYSLNDAVSVFTWEAIASGASVEATVDQVAAHFDGDTATMRAETMALIEQFQRDELLVAGDSAAESVAVALPADTAYVTPRLQVFTDMQDLLLLDPIHEVDEAGWPVLPQQPNAGTAPN